MLSLLTKRAETLRAVRVDDGFGGDQESWESVLSSYPCRLYRKTGRLERGERGEDEPHEVLLIGPLADIKSGDKVIVEGKTYLVELVSVSEDSKGPSHVQATLKALR